jgi:hypothetical protein
VPGKTAIPQGPDDLAASAMFELLWDKLTDVIGTAATATLLRRSIKRAVGRQPTLAELGISREGFEYKYKLPELWQERDPKTLQELRVLIDELCPLLAELTGSLLISNLRSIPEFQQTHLIPGAGEPKKS